MKKYVDFIEKLQGFWGVLLCIGLTLVVFLQVVTRYVFHAPFLWSEEVARFLFLWVALMGASMSVKNEKHFVIELFKVEKIRNRNLRKILRLIPNLCVLFFALLIAILGYEYFLVSRFRVGVNSQINMQYVFIAIPIAGVSMLIYSLYHLVNVIKSWDADK
jgi:TRAP-type C4-dicarboxylate transport system permease small subunit